MYQWEKPALLTVNGCIIPMDWDPVRGSDSVNLDFSFGVALLLTQNVEQLHEDLLNSDCAFIPASL